MAELNTTQELRRIGKALAAARGAQGLSQREVARRMRTDHKRIGEWEQGKRCLRLDTLLHLMSVLGITQDDLLRDLGQTARPAPPDPAPTPFPWMADLPTARAHLSAARDHTQQAKQIFAETRRLFAAAREGEPHVCT